MSMAYVKLFGSILASTIWREPPQTKVLWITMLAMADRDGLVEGSVPGLADMARLSVDECRVALKSLEAPDPDSRTKTNEGRRVQEVPGGWLILNYEFYRDKQSAEDTREKNRLRQKRKYDRDTGKTSREPHAPHGPSREVTPSSQAQAHLSPEERDAPAARESIESPEERPRGEPVRKPEGVDAQTWSDWLRIRRAKHAALTQTAMKVLAREAGKAGKTVPEVLIVCVERGWAGFQASWLLPGAAPGKQSKPVSHIPNMPLGASGCGCAECVAFRSKNGASA